MVNDGYRILPALKVGGGEMALLGRDYEKKRSNGWNYVGIGLLAN